MNSFIYNTPDLLEKLFVIAQQKPVGTPRQLNAAALEVIRKLRSELSGLRATTNPTFPDIESLQNFKAWAVKNEAKAQGNALVDESGRFNRTVLPKFLTDLRDRFASNPEFSESLANVIDQANKSKLTNIPLYPPVKTEEPTDAKDPNNKPSHVNVSVKLNDSAVDPKTGKPTPGQNVTPQQELTGLVSSGGLSILDGSTVDFDDINRDADRIRGRLEKNNSRAWQALGQVTVAINNITLNFHQLVNGKTGGLITLACSPTDDAARLENIINSTFNNRISRPMAEKNNKPLSYRWDELAEIAKYFADVMVEVHSFYNILLTVPFFKGTPDIQQVLIQQSEWAMNYNTGFLGAHDTLMSRFGKANSVR